MHLTTRFSSTIETAPESSRPGRAALLGCVALGVVLISPPLAALEKNATVQRTFTLTSQAGHRTLVVDNVMGSIDIQAVAGNTVELTLKQAFSARTAAELARAQQEVVLEVNESAGRLELVQGGTWRCERQGSDRDDAGVGRSDERRSRHRGCCCDQDERKYEAKFDWVLKVPRDLDLEVSNVNDGGIHIVGTVGHLEVRHVNDAVTLERVAGVVDALTVNGELKVEFASLPTADCKFGTVNGDIELAFPRGLGAELSFATLNGEVYTDFPFAMAKLPATSERSNSGGRHHHESGRETAATIGSGGIGLDCNTVNGDIYIRERS
ncbi:MAG: hypothetical protein ABI639_06105 [Thermoanaerobaculia bacterium]